MWDIDPEVDCEGERGSVGEWKRKRKKCPSDPWVTSGGVTHTHTQYFKNHDFIQNSIYKQDCVKVFSDGLVPVYRLRRIKLLILSD